MAESIREGSVTRLHRGGLSARHIDAYVLGASDELVLLQPIRDRVDLDGYDVVRLEDVTRVSRPPQAKARFYREALALKRQRPSLPAGLKLDNIRSVLLSACERYPLVVIHREGVSADACEIGRLLSTTGKTYRLEWIRPDAVFERDRRTFKFVNVTLVQFDGEYENTLARVAERRNRARRAKARSR